MRKLLTILLFCLSFWGIRVEAEKVEYSIPNYHGLLTIGKDNNAQFEQKISYSFDSDYQGQYVSLGTAGKMPQNFTIDPKPTIEVYHNQKKVEAKGEIEDLGDGYRLKIYNAGSRGDRVDVKVTWQLKNLLSPYKDVAELDWKPISDWDKSLEKVRFTIRVADDNKDSQLWAHRGYLKEEPSVSQTKKAAKEYTVESKDLSGIFELHGYWDRKDLLQDSVPFTNEIKKPAIISLEKRISFRSQAMKLSFVVILPLVFALLLLGQLFLYIRLKKGLDKNVLSSKDSHLYEVPEDLSPLVLTQNIYQKSFHDLSPLTEKIKTKVKGISFESLTQATLLDLIDRRALKITKEDGQTLLKVVTKESLTPAENSFLEMAFEDASELPISSLFKQFEYDPSMVEKLKKQYAGKELEKAVHKSSQPLTNKMNHYSRFISEAVKETCEKLRLENPYRKISKSEKRGLNFMSGLGLLAMALVITLLIFLVIKESVIAFFYLIMALLGFALNYYIYNKTRKYHDNGIETENGALRLHKWRSFRNMIEDINSFNAVEIEGLVVWNRILVYATLFGEAKKVEKYLKIHQIALPEQYRQFSPAELAVLMYSTTPHFVSNLSTVSDSSHFSVSAGGGGISGGGGFSGGGGGGGGGAF
ncbi:DUF2207 domain-containing protein [Streptococcus catagoni]|uniref:DUF2207 domain-containing protein n=1 Tax=Streptococcus catagoni TaxID=2654874 RepID=UPI00140A8BC8|nr:DUF2207 domain-containing protein [Streptococcus catagoni]